MVTFEEIENQQRLVNEKYTRSITDDEWSDFNSNWNRLGHMMEEFGRVEYNRIRKINIILESE